jgi:malate synthase
MEDAATAEISRAQLWQWIRSERGILDDGRKVTTDMFRTTLNDEIARLKQPSHNRFDTARELFDQITTNDHFAEFLTLPAYEHLE